MKLAWKQTSDGERWYANVDEGQLIVSENKYSNWQIDCYVLPAYMRESWFFTHAIGCQFTSADAAVACLSDWYSSTRSSDDTN